MIKIEKTEVFGWEAAIRGMRNPLNSWGKSDSAQCFGADGFEDCHVNASGRCPREDDFRHDIYCIGNADLKLMKILVGAGTDHSKFMRIINVTCDITAPLYWWKEFDTYKVGTVANSCSTMHKITAKEFTLDDFSHEHIGDGIRTEVFYDCFENIIDCLNEARQCYLDTKDKSWWWQIIQLLPSSYNQRRTVQLNYAVLRNMYQARLYHKLDEWRQFCKWVEQLPHGELITALIDTD